MAEVAAREIALLAMVEIDGSGAYANLALNGALERYRPNKLDKAFITELVYNTVRSLNTIDWIINHFSKQKVIEQTVWIRNILRLGVYQLFYLDRVPDSAACNEAVNLSKKYGNPGQAKFVNAVLRSIIRGKDMIVFPDSQKNPDAYLSLKYSHPQWLVHRLIKQLGYDNAVRFLAADNVNPPLTVRTNILRCERDQLQKWLTNSGIEAEKTRYASEGLKLRGVSGLNKLSAHRQGLFQVQDESSMLASAVLAPRPGSTVIDTCCAPGGKTTHLAQLMNNEGKILAFDLHANKLALVEENCRRLGITCVATEAADAEDLGRRFYQQADYVLVDAPCSGLGVLRRRADLRWRKHPDEISKLPALQSALLRSAAACVKPGGSLVYSTCTIVREENENIITDFLKEHEEFAGDDLKQFLPSELDWQGTFKHGWIQILPYMDEMDGFFIARLVRKS